MNTAPITRMAAVKAGNIFGVNIDAGISQTNAPVKANRSKIPPTRSAARVVPDMIFNNAPPPGLGAVPELGAVPGFVAVPGLGAAPGVVARRRAKALLPLPDIRAATTPRT